MANPQERLHVNGNILVEGNLTEYSDRNAKTAFRPVDGASVLAALMRTPVSTWRYKNDPATVRHMGPVAQDFYAAFGLGIDERHIAPLDANGVALAAIQELQRRAEASNARITQLEQENADLAARLAALEQALAELQAGK
ncbi:MAG: tail fiber domain-containing protein [Oscillochloris sp.]|nr:tail fiber domain-containing protein [Oscillochloris sp.]